MKKQQYAAVWMCTLQLFWSLQALQEIHIVEKQDTLQYMQPKYTQ